MRSRYTAYALGRIDYVIATTHPDSPHRRDDVGAWRSELQAYCAAVRFTGLEVVSASTQGDAGSVHFRAHLQGRAGATVQEEHSRFLRLEGRWMYVDGR